MSPQSRYRTSGLSGLKAEFMLTIACMAALPLWLNILKTGKLFQFVLSHYEKLRELIYKPSFTLTYNDFYRTNFTVRKDKTAAMMFDYNLLGKGYRLSDFRNVCWDLSKEARAAFIGEYSSLYLEKHGHTRIEEEKPEKQIDDVAAPLFALLVAFLEHEDDENWGIDAKNEAMSGALLSKAKSLLS